MLENGYILFDSGLNSHVKVILHAGFFLNSDAISCKANRILHAEKKSRRRRNISCQSFNNMITYKPVPACMHLQKVSIYLEICTCCIPCLGKKLYELEGVLSSRSLTTLCSHTTKLKILNYVLRERY